MKFNVGDRVSHYGHEGTVICISFDLVTCGVEFDEPDVGWHNCEGVELSAGRMGTENNSRWFYDYELELVKPIKETNEEANKENDKIVITHDGKTTTATLYCEDGTKKVVTAKCHPEDTFDFFVGAKLAVERLHDYCTPKYNGKVVCVDNYRNLCAYSVGKIYQFVNGKLTDNHGNKLPLDNPIRSFKEWQEFTSSKFIEIVE